MEINEEKNNQWQALKGMGFKAHWDYFWDYYKIHTIVVVCVIVFVVMLIHDINSNIPYALNAVFVNANTINIPEALEADFAQSEGIDTKEQGVYVDTSTTISVSSTTTTDISSTEKIYAQIAANELDVMLADPQLFERFSQNEMFLDLRDYMTEDELSSLGDSVYYIDMAEIEAADAKETDYFSEEAMEKEMEEAANYSFERRDPSSMEKPVPVGIILSDNKILKDNEMYPGVVPIAGIVVSTQRGDTAGDFIRFLLK